MKADLIQIIFLGTITSLPLIVKCQEKDSVYYQKKMTLFKS